MATRTQTEHQPMENRPADSSGFYGWVAFWLIVAVIAIGAIAYAAYRPNLNPATMGDTSTTRASPVNTAATDKNGATPSVNPNGNTASVNPAANGNTPGGNNASSSGIPNGTYQPPQPNAMGPNGTMPQAGAPAH